MSRCTRGLSVVIGEAQLVSREDFDREQRTDRMLQWIGIALGVLGLVLPWGRR